MRSDSIRVVGTGNGGSHAWNLVKIDSAWYNLDATWDDPVPDQKGRISYAYFNVPDSLMQKNHVWNVIDYPAAMTQSYIFMSDMNNAVISGGYFFYSSNDDNDRLYKMRLNGTDKIKVLSDRAPYFAIYGDLIYYSNYSQGGYLFKVNKDGTGREKLNNKLSIVESINEGVLYYKDAASGNILTLTIGSTNTLQRIDITAPASKLIYNIGEKLDVTGLVVTGTYSDGSTKVESITAENVTGFNSTVTATDQVLTITDGAKTTTFRVQISDFPANLNVPPDKEWRITFSQPVDANTLQNNIVIRRTDVIFIKEDSFSITPVLDTNNSKVVIVNHSTPFVVGATYELSVNVGIKDTSGKSLSKPSGLSFKTIVQ